MPPVNYLRDDRFLRSMRTGGYLDTQRMSADDFATGLVNSPRTMIPGPGVIEHNDASATIGSGQFNFSSGANLYAQENDTHSRIVGQIYSMLFATPASGSDQLFGPANKGGSYSNILNGLSPGARYVGSATLNARIGSAQTATLITDLAEDDWISIVTDNPGGYIFRNQDLLFLDPLSTDNSLRLATACNSCPAEIKALRRSLRFVPTPLVAHNFNLDPDGAVPTTNGIGMLQNGGSGYSWSNIAGTSTIVNGFLTAGGAIHRKRIASVNADCLGMAVIPATHDEVGILLNYAADGSGWLAFVSTTTLRIFEVAAGGGLTQHVSSGISRATNDIIQFVRVSSTRVVAMHVTGTTWTWNAYDSATAGNTEAGVGIYMSANDRCSKVCYYSRLQTNFPLAGIAA